MSPMQDPEPVGIQEGILEAIWERIWEGILEGIQGEFGRESIGNHP